VDLVSVSKNNKSTHRLFTHLNTPQDKSMTPHAINLNKNFIAGWTMSDTTVCDDLVEYHKTNPLSFVGKINNNEYDPRHKDSMDCQLLEPELARRYFTHLQQVIAAYAAEYPYCDYYSKWGIIEEPVIQHYRPGGGYHAWHTERNSGGLENVTRRHLVYMTYLSDVSDRGETEWLHQNLKVVPKKGLTVIWPADWTFTHRGIASPSEHKWIITGWFSYTDGM
jgi:hypothetical protein